MSTPEKIRALAEAFLLRHTDRQPLESEIEDVASSLTAVWPVVFAPPEGSEYLISFAWSNKSPTESGWGNTHAVIKRLDWDGLTSASAAIRAENGFDTVVILAATLLVDEISPPAPEEPR